ncbi:hypothetical protein [Actinomadura sp. WMMA1423]|uniref:hypothetical protein n=1 Tax=Actinomadura sp. WMMA1423 TaxID=2591108 RepID=UPI00143DE1C1|nr:hypothetical protein [Actinomadura sp. WMMA1423]
MPGRSRSTEALEEAEADLREAGVKPLDPTVTWTDASDLPDVDVDLSALDDDAPHDAKQ